MKTKALISFAKLICVLVFAYAKSRFSHDEAHLIEENFEGSNIHSRVSMMHVTRDTTLRID